MIYSIAILAMINHSQDMTLISYENIASGIRFAFIAKLPVSFGRDKRPKQANLILTICTCIYVFVYVVKLIVNTSKYTIQYNTIQYYAMQYSTIRYLPTIVNTTLAAVFASKALPAPSAWPTRILAAILKPRGSWKIQNLRVRA